MSSRLHDAHDVRMPGEDQQRVDERRDGSARGSATGRRAASRWRADRDDSVRVIDKRPRVEAKAAHDAAPADLRAEFARQEVIQRQREHRPGEADEPEQRQRGIEREVLVGDFEVTRIGCVAARLERQSDTSTRCEDVRDGPGKAEPAVQ